MDPDPDQAIQVNPDPVRIQGFLMTKNWKNTAEKNVSFLIKNDNTSPKASLKDVKATGEAFSPQKGTSSNSKNEIY